jgi:hypothetical protein
MSLVSIPRRSRGRGDVSTVHKKCAVNCIGYYTTTKENNSYSVLISPCRNCDEHISLLIANKVINCIICTYFYDNSPRLPHTSLIVVRPYTLKSRYLQTAQIQKRRAFMLRSCIISKRDMMTKDKD